MLPDEKYWAPHQTETEATNSLQLTNKILNELVSEQSEGPGGHEKHCL